MGSAGSAFDARSRIGAAGTRAVEAASWLSNGFFRKRISDASSQVAADEAPPPTALPSSLRVEVGKMEDTVSRKNSKVGAALAELAREEKLREDAQQQPPPPHAAESSRAATRSCEDQAPSHLPGRAAEERRNFDALSEQSDVDREVDKVLHEWTSGRSCGTESHGAAFSGAASKGDEGGVFSRPAFSSSALSDRGSSATLEELQRSTRRRLSSSFERAAGSHDDGSGDEGHTAPPKPAELPMCSARRH